MSEEIKCRNGHVWGGWIRTVDENKNEVQHPELLGQPCDCNRLIYDEGKCSCPGKNKWEVKPIENPNYGR